MTLSGTSFQRAALTGDVTAAANNNVTTVARIQGRNVANTAPANGQVLKWNGTAWAPAADNNTNTTYSGSTSITLSGTSFQRAALTGDVTAAANNNATTVARIQGRNVANTAPANGQTLTWNGTAWTPSGGLRTVTTSVTLATTDNGGYVYVNSASAVTVTVPSTLPAGFSCVIVQKGAGQVMVAGSGVTLETARGTKTRARFSSIGVIKDTVNTATITGDAVN
ncbi:hypothetical protein PG614_00980 [Riemerella anatipestifer]|nr:hypothetical protein [Riemerella anatipestifer]